MKLSFCVNTFLGILPKQQFQEHIDDQSDDISGFETCDNICCIFVINKIPKESEFITQNMIPNIIKHCFFLFYFFSRNVSCWHFVIRGAKTRFLSPSHDPKIHRCRGGLASQWGSQREGSAAGGRRQERSGDPSAGGLRPVTWRFGKASLFWFKGWKFLLEFVFNFFLRSLEGFFSWISGLAVDFEGLNQMSGVVNWFEPWILSCLSPLKLTDCQCSFCWCFEHLTYTTHTHILLFI